MLLISDSCGCCCWALSLLLFYKKYLQWIIVNHQGLLCFSLTFTHSFLTHVYVLPVFNFCVCDAETPAGCCISTILGWYHWIWSYWKSIFIAVEVCQSHHKILKPTKGGKMILVSIAMPKKDIHNILLIIFVSNILQK